MEKKTNGKIKANRNTFSIASDVDVEKPCFFNAEFKNPNQQFLISLGLMKTFLIFLKLNSNYTAILHVLADSQISRNLYFFLLNILTWLFGDTHSLMCLCI